MKKNEIESKKELAYLLYMQGISQAEILQRVQIGSTATLSKWVKEGEWKIKKAAKTITRTELINKTLQQINKLLDDANQEGDQDVQADKLIKLANMVEKLDSKGSPVLIMDVFMDFGRFLQNKSFTDPDVTLDFMKLVNRYQDIYISNKLNNV